MPLKDVSEGENHEKEPVTVLISNHVVRVTREYTGRGPGRARTYITENVVTVVLHDTLTRGERSLVEDGRSDQVQQMRLALQDTMRRDLVAGVEAILGRKIIAFMSANHMDPDMAIESFILE
jgi:uncharacterized protein YbcI